MLDHQLGRSSLQQSVSSHILSAAKAAMNTRIFCGIILFCFLLLSPVVIEDSRALAVDKKKIMKALFLTKMALKKKKLLVLPMPIPIMVEKKHHEHHMEHHHGW